MGLVIISAVIFIVLAAREFKDSEVFLGFMWLIAGGLITFLVLVLSCIFGFIVPEAEYNYHDDNERQIVSMQDNIFLYMRSTDKLVYTYAYKDGDGIRTYSVKADNSVIMYDNSDAKMITQKGNFKNWWHYLYAFPTREKYIFYVPQGTVKEEYKVDLKG